MGFKDFISGILDPEPPVDDSENKEEEVEEMITNEQPEIKRAPAQSASGISSALELKIVKPDSFASVTQIADHLLNRCTVVLNLEATNKETARRIVDFLTGVAYSIDGQIKPVANNTFIITPNNVDVSGEVAEEQKNNAAAQDREFDNF